jgi:hypothetical protein
MLVALSAPLMMTEKPDAFFAEGPFTVLGCSPLPPHRRLSRRSISIGDPLFYLDRMNVVYPFHSLQA